MEDRQLAERMRPVLSGLSAQIGLQETDVLCTKPQTAPDLANGVLTLPVTGTRLRLCCPDSTPGGRDLLRLAAEIAMGLSRQAGETKGDGGLRKALLGELPEFEQDQLQNTAPFRDGHERVLLVFSTLNMTDGQDSLQLLSELTPMQETDRLIRIDRRTVALLKAQDEEETTEDLIQFSQALQETLMAETGLRMLAGISDSFTEARRLHRAFNEAQTAIDVGRRFRPEDSVFAYAQLSLQRFLLEAPPGVCRKYHELLFNSGTTSLFNEEMMYTIDMFFRKDLNMSDTARQLYIHRNTLVYRLNKVQKQTGLDLRTFSDAVTFKLLMEMKKCSDEQNDH